MGTIILDVGRCAGRKYGIYSTVRAMGGLAVSAAAWSVAVRNRWIGWDKRKREQKVNEVMGNSRFLILPWVHVPHLASHVLLGAPDNCETTGTLAMGPRRSC